jgi:hypothetical protein
VRLSAPAFARLICSLWQSNPPLSYSLRVTRYVLRAARTSCFVRREHAVRSSRQPSTGRNSSRFRISKCSRPARTRSRNARGSL